MKQRSLLLVPKVVPVALVLAVVRSSTCHQPCLVAELLGCQPFGGLSADASLIAETQQLMLCTNCSVANNKQCPNSAMVVSVRAQVSAKPSRGLSQVEPTFPYAGAGFPLA